MTAPDMKSLSEEDLNDLVQQAQNRLDELQREKLANVEQEFTRLAASVGKTPLEIVQGMLPSGQSAKGPRKSKGIAKYCNPENIAQTWTGVGKRPKWVHEALARGVTLESMAIAKS